MKGLASGVQEAEWYSESKEKAWEVLDRKQQSPPLSLVLLAPWYMCVCAQQLNRVWLSVTSWTVARQALLSMGFFRQKYWSGLPFLSPEDQTHVSWGPCIGRRTLYHWTTWKTPNTQEADLMLFSGLHRFSASILSVPGVSVAVKRTTAPDNHKTGPQRFSLHPRWNIPWEHCDHPLPLPLLPPSGLVISCSFAAQLNYGPLESILPSLIRTVISLAKCLHYSSYYTEWWLLCYLW